MKRLIYLIPLGFLLSLLLPRCAIVVAPTGGPKDTIPPVLVKSIPELNATNVTRDEITITFDEYIKLDKISEKLVLSPPQEQLPQFRIKGKGLEISFAEELDDSTTYTLYFADAILDNNEGNPLENFEFAFSTGPVIDSLRYAGRVLDAYTLKPREGVFVMLYTSFEDSIPMKERPRYVTKTNAEGIFYLSNIKYGSYKIFALADGNSSYKFDQVSEAIAFLDNPIDTSMLKEPSKVTSNIDSLVTLRMFQEQNKALSLTDYDRPQRRHLKMGFSGPYNHEVSIKPLLAGIDTIKPWYIESRSMANDTINLWITNGEISAIDTLMVLATYQKTDSLLNLFTKVDTLRMFYQDAPKQSRSKKRGDKEEEKEPVEPKLSVKTSVKNGANLTPSDSIRFAFGLPLQRVDTAMLRLFDQTDSIMLPTPAITPDTIDPRYYYLHHAWEQKKGYQLTVLPGAFINLEGLANDTLQIKFKGADPEQFGVIKLMLSGVTPNIMVELLTSKDEVVMQKVVEVDGAVDFTYVKPGSYFIRFVNDANQNGKWDTGQYLKGIQPEYVTIYQDPNGNKEIQVKANWEYELKFNLNNKSHVGSNELRDVPNAESNEYKPLRGQDIGERSL